MQDRVVERRMTSNPFQNSFPVLHISTEHSRRKSAIGKWDLQWSPAGNARKVIIDSKWHFPNSFYPTEYVLWDNAPHGRHVRDTIAPSPLTIHYLLFYREKPESIISLHVFPHPIPEHVGLCLWADQMSHVRHTWNDKKATEDKAVNQIIKL